MISAAAVSLVWCGAVDSSACVHVGSLVPVCTFDSTGVYSACVHMISLVHVLIRIHLVDLLPCASLRFSLPFIFLSRGPISVTLSSILRVPSCARSRGAALPRARYSGASAEQGSTAPREQHPLGAILNLIRASRANEAPRQGGLRPRAGARGPATAAWRPAFGCAARSGCAGYGG